jgi:hypothetical protein
MRSHGDANTSPQHTLAGCLETGSPTANHFQILAAFLWEALLRYPNLRYGNPTGLPCYAMDIPLPDLARRLRRDERTVRDWLPAERAFLRRFLRFCASNAWSPGIGI